MSEAAETAGTIITVEDRATVEALHEALAEVARAPARENVPYGICLFFAADPEGLTVEIQTFLHPTGTTNKRGAIVRSVSDVLPLESLY